MRFLCIDWRSINYFKFKYQLTYEFGMKWASIWYLYYLDRYTCNQECFSMGTRGNAVPTLFWSLFWWGIAFPQFLAGERSRDVILPAFAGFPAAPPYEQSHPWRKRSHTSWNGKATLSLTYYEELNDWVAKTSNVKVGLLRSSMAIKICWR